MTDPWCKTCGALVEWHLTKAHGKWMPIDPEPTSDGRFVFGSGLRLEVATADTPPQRRRYHCHWFTSPRCTPPASEPREEQPYVDDGDDRDLEDET